ncbi:hypothetical protein ULG90_02930 [Halopseudomonas pachastrellae]|nr:hypothetical protein ULG90_02930 [Halopseudomonas pachastrellae]
MEQYWVHLGERLRFDAPVTCMRLPRELLVAAPQSASPMLARIARQQAELALAAMPGQGTLSEVVFAALYQQIRKRVGLEQLAEQLGMSPATLQRRFAARWRGVSGVAGSGAHPAGDGAVSGAWL